MRKIKKINGYLIVKFNDRELRVWADTALGNYGVIDAELYTGRLDVDRSVMEYGGAETLEEAIERARGLESELEVDEPVATYTVIKETDDATEEDTVEPRLIIAGWKTQLETQVKSYRYSDIDPRTAAHELYGFMVALERLGLIEEDDCFVKPDAFKPQPGGDFVHSLHGAPTRKTFELGLELMTECPPNDCMVYLNIFEICLDLDEQIDRVTGLARSTLERELYRRQRELFNLWMTNYAIGEYRKKCRAKKAELPVEEITSNMKGLQKLIEHFEADVPRSITIDQGYSYPGIQSKSTNLFHNTRYAAEAFTGRKKETSVDEMSLYPYGEYGELLVGRPYRATDAAEYRRRLRESDEELKAVGKLLEEVEDYNGKAHKPTFKNTGYAAEAFTGQKR